jgi:hypothetical protein
MFLKRAYLKREIFMRSLFTRSFIIMLCGSAAFAGKINLDARTEMESYSSNTAMGKPAYSVFKINRLKIDFQGTLGEANSYRLRIDPLKVGDSTVTTSKRANTSSFVDFGFITHKVNEEWNVSMGKIITGMGGTEGANNPGDIYLRSLTGDDTAAVFWPVGAQLQGTFGDHKININASNISEDVYDNATSKNLSSTSHMYGLTYMGKLSEGTILPNVSYHTEDFKNTANAKKVTKTYLAAGAKFLVSDFEIEADVLNNTKKNDVQAAADVLDLMSAVLLARYKMEGSSVHLKYESSALKTATGLDTSTKTDITGMTLAYEFKPVKDDNWRAHVALTQKNTKPENADTMTENKAMVGMRILADFLK